MLWPNLYLLGVPKAGSTTLARMLGEAHEIHAPVIKESGFFASARQWERGHDYAQRTFDFATTRRYSLEATPWNYYLQPALERIASLPHDGPLTAIVLLRDPVERAISMYHDQHGLGIEQRTIDEAFSDDLEADWNWSPDDLDDSLKSSYLRGGQYVRRLRAIDNAFDELVVIDFADLASDAKSIANRLSGLLGVDGVAEVSQQNARSREAVPISKTVGRLADALPTRLRELAGTHVVPKLRGPLSRATAAVSRSVETPAAQRPSASVIVEASSRFESEREGLALMLGQQPSW
jgi:hypothetical protein